jgi:hypothetical protein
VGVDDERRAELLDERSEGAARLRALLERARVVAEEEINLAAVGEALEAGPLARDRPVPVATGSTRPGGKRAAVGETAQRAEPEACARRQVVQAEAERHRAGRERASLGAGERLGVVVVSVDEQKLEPGPPEQGARGAEEAAPLRVVRQVAEVAERDERAAVLLDGALDQVAQVASVAVQVTKGEQPAHSSRAYRVCSCPRARGSAPGAGRGARQTFETVLGEGARSEGLNYWGYDSEAARFRMIFFSNSGPSPRKATATRGRVVEDTLTFHRTARFQHALSDEATIKTNRDGTVSVAWWLHDGDWQPWTNNTFTNIEDD